MIDIHRCDKCGADPPPSGPPTRAEVIAHIERSRRVHLDWVQWYEDGGRIENVDGDAVGDANHHRCVAAEYDRVLAVLRRCGCGA